MIDECDGCNFETKVEEYGQGVGKDFMNRTGRQMKLCNLCANTHAGNAVDFPNQYENDEVMFAISYVGNVILKELADIKNILNHLT
jgi:hypothetical protein